MSNPWNSIKLTDYENHMSLDSVGQLQALNRLMAVQFNAYPVKTAVVLGVAGGNGLEHIDTDKYRTVYGIDINEEYLKEAHKRHKDKEKVLRCLQLDIINEADKLPNAELVIANLLVEYIGYDAFKNAVSKIDPEYVSVVIQINTDTKAWVSDSPYLHSFDRLDEVHHQMEENELAECLDEIGYVKTGTEREDLPNGKAFVRLDFKKQRNRIITTERLVIRPVETGDCAAIHKYAGDPSIDMMLYLPNETMEDTENYVKFAVSEWAKEEPEDREYVVLLDGEIIGGVNLEKIGNDPVYEIGWVIRKDKRGSGYATEAAKALSDYAFEVLKAEQVQSHCDSRNNASEKVMRNIGMTLANDKGTRIYPKTATKSGEYLYILKR
jgi:RimJ/RimL family protein N-acetyltransferase